MTKPTKKQRVKTMTVDEKVNKLICIVSAHIAWTWHCGLGKDGADELLNELCKLQETKARK